MQCTIRKDAFLEGITKVQGIISRKTSFAITGNVLVHAAESGIAVEATDLETAFSGFYPAQVTNPGTVTLPGKKLFEIIREFPGETVALKELENGWIEISGEKVVYNIVGMDPNDFPELPKVDETDFFSLDASVFSGMVTKINLQGGMSTDEKRPHLTGVLIERVVPGEGEENPEEDADEPVEPNPLLAAQEGRHVLRMVATDGTRLAKVDYTAQEGEEIPRFGRENKIVLPKKSVAEIMKLVETESGLPVLMGVQGNYLVVRRGNETLICRLVEGQYPNYAMVVPRGVESSFTVDKRAFQSTLKRMSILISDRYKAVRFKVSQGILIISITNPEIGESKEELTVDFDGADFEAAFNPRFFVEALGTMSSEEIRIRIKDDTLPCILDGENDPAFLTVIMPMRV
jgi:DNA polymerase-3 subunit beta